MNIYILRDKYFFHEFGFYYFAQHILTVAI